MTLKSRKFLIWGGLAISLFFLYQSLKGIKIEEVAQALSKSSIWMGFPLAFLYGLFFLVKAIRWRMLLSPIHLLKVKQVLPAIMIGTLSNNILPAHMGEFVRMYLLAKEYKIRSTSVLATLVLERIFDFLAVIMILNISFWIGANRPQELVNAAYIVGSISCIILILTICFVFWTKSFINFFQKITTFLSDGLRSWLLHQIAASAKGFNSIKKFNLILGIAFFSVIQWIIMGLSSFISLKALSIDVPFSASYVILAFTVIGLAIPAAPGFFGTIEYCFILALIPYGVSSTDAFSSAIFFHLVNYLFVLIIGFCYIKNVGYSISYIRSVTDLRTKS